MMFEETLLDLERDLLEGTGAGLLEKGNGFLETAATVCDVEVVLAW